QLIPAAAAGGGLDVAAVVSARLLRDQAQRPAYRVAAEQGPLRAAQDLDALEVEDIENRTVGRGVVDIIDIEPDPRLEGGQEVDLPEAANERLIGLGAIAGAAAVHFHVGNGIGDVDDTGDAALLKLLGVHSRDRDRNVLQGLL